jgi:protein-tyrosine phosphatase
MVKVMFVCLGNICRSPMAEFVFKDLVKKKGIDDKFYIQSAATSNEEIGNSVHPGTRNLLKRLGISTDGKYAVKLSKSDYDNYDYFIGMESYNIRNMKRILGDDKENKIYRFLDFSDNPRDIADPWYTGDFESTYKDVLEGCNAFLNYLIENNIIDNYIKTAH